MPTLQAVNTQTQRLKAETEATLRTIASPDCLGFLIYVGQFSLFHPFYDADDKMYQQGCKKQIIMLLQPCQNFG
jgi:hypothetical protein